MQTESAAEVQYEYEQKTTVFLPCGAKLIAEDSMSTPCFEGNHSFVDSENISIVMRKRNEIHGIFFNLNLVFLRLISFLLITSISGPISL